MRSPQYGNFFLIEFTRVQLNDPPGVLVSGPPPTKGAARTLAEEARNSNRAANRQPRPHLLETGSLDQTPFLRRRRLSTDRNDWGGNAGVRSPRLSRGSRLSEKLV